MALGRTELSAPAELLPVTSPRPDGRHLLVSVDFGARVHTLDVDEPAAVGWTPEECVQFLGTENLSGAVSGPQFAT